MSAVEIIRLVTIILLMTTAGLMLGLLMRIHVRLSLNEQARRWNLYFWLIGIPYMLFALGTAEEIQAHIDVPTTWRTPFYFTISVIGFASQCWLYWLLNNEDRYSQYTIEDGEEYGEDY